MEQEEGNKEHFCTIHLCTLQRRGTEKGKIQAQNRYMRRRDRKSKNGKTREAQVQREQNKQEKKQTLL
jgi:hypothetical protein